jgi:predicted P-loop ATPase
MHRPVTPIQWREVGAHGQPKPSLFNTRLGIMSMKISCRHDQFRDVTIIGYVGDDTVHEIKPIMGELNDAALLILRTRFSEHFNFEPDEKLIRDAVKSLAFDHCFDPILDLLDNAQANWDRTMRLPTWPVEYLGCKDTPLNCAIGRKALIAAARRARHPGCKFDNITVLEGPEGKNKSTAIRILAADEFFSDQSILGARDKEVQEQLGGVWMHESADLTGLKKAEVQQVKSFASRQWDRARPAYGHVLVRKPRRGILFATTNDQEYLQSETGNRRFWPLACGDINIEALRHDRLQLLGEAAHYEAIGESVVLPMALWTAAMDEQEKRRAPHPWEDILSNIPDFTDESRDFTTGQATNKKIIYRANEGNGVVLEQVFSADLLEHVLRIPRGQHQKHHSMTLAICMRLLGWERPDGKKLTINGRREGGYCRRVGPSPACQGLGWAQQG